MAIFQFADPVRNARAGQFETTVGVSPILQLRTGAPPANCSLADSGTLVCAMTLPSDWLTTAAGGAVSMNGTWTGTGDAGAGSGGLNAGYFRIKNSAGTTVYCQGDVTATGGGGAMTINNTLIVAGQTVNVTGFTLTEP